MKKIMEAYLSKFLNLGIDKEMDLETTKRIRLCNNMSVTGISVSTIVLIYICFFSSSLIIILLSALGTVSTFIPPTFNYFGKTLASRISFLLVAFTDVVIFAVIFGADLHFQYYLFGLLGLPLIFFGNELGRRKLFLSAVGILFYIYLEWHFTVFDSIVSIHPYSNTLRIINDILIFLIILMQSYFFARENAIHIEEIKAKKDLEEKNKELKHFAYIASHDLKEPLRTVDNFIGIIKEEYHDSSDENISTYFSFIQDAMLRMRTMIDGLLNYSKVGKSGDFQRTDINQLLNEIELDLKELITENKAVIKKNNLPQIVCLSLEIRQLFQNLITNAIKFKHPESTPIIEITGKSIQNYWEFCVADNGIGINPKKQETIFQMFTKLHISEEYEGQGIGLAFCKEIVEIHKGKIWVESIPDNGSRFYFTIFKETNTY